MRIGFTYDLRKDYLERGFTEEETAEFDSQETINFVAETIAALGHDVTRIGNIYELIRRLAKGESWDLVFNITEGLYGRSRESQVPAVLEAYDILYTFSDPLTLALSLDKSMAKKIIRDAGILTPDFATIACLEDLKNPGLLPSMSFPLFVKPVSEGTGKGVTPASIIRTPVELKQVCAALLDRYSQPVMVETYLPGREFTVGILGTGEKAQAVGVLEIELLKDAEPLVYSYLNKELCEEHVEYILTMDHALIEEASGIALAAYRLLGCRDAGRVDLKADASGRLNFLEVNPLAGIHPTHSDLPILCSKVGIPYRDLIAGIISSALERKQEVRRRNKF
jgi:D-alanine-D-alanine ligase